MDTAHVAAQGSLKRYRRKINKATGWQTSTLTHGETTILHAVDDDDANIQITRDSQGVIRSYVIERPLSAMDTGKWYEIRPDRPLDHFITHHALYPLANKACSEDVCQCGKLKFRTHRRAQAGLTESKIRAISLKKEHRCRKEARVYGCPDNPRIWHLTSKKEWEEDTDQ